MDDKLLKQSDLFINNRIAMRHGFLWDYASVQGVCALMWSAYQKEIDVEKIRQCKKALKDEAEVFCYLEDNAFVAAAAMLALSDNPPYMLKKLKKLYKMMMAEGFKPTGQLLLTALILIRFHDEREFPAIIKKTKHICLSLKTGPWHEMVVPADQIEAAQSTIGADVRAVMQREKQYRRLLRDEFPSPVIAELLSSSLIIDHSNEAGNVVKLLSLYATVRGESEKIYFKYAYDYTALAVLTMVTKVPEETMTKVFEVYDYLNARQELNHLKLAQYQYFYYSAMIVAMTDIGQARYSKYTFESDGDIFMSASIVPLISLVISRT